MVWSFGNLWQSATAVPIKSPLTNDVQGTTNLGSVPQGGVAIIDPYGNPGWVPFEKLEAAIKAGAKKIETTE